MATPSAESSSQRSTPIAPSQSPGSSVSSAFREEYEDLLKYAVVTPIVEPSIGGRAALLRVPRSSNEPSSLLSSQRPQNTTLTARDLDGIELVKLLNSSETSSGQEGSVIAEGRNSPDNVHTASQTQQVRSEPIAAMQGMPNLIEPVDSAAVIGGGRGEVAMGSGSSVGLTEGHPRHPPVSVSQLNEDSPVVQDRLSRDPELVHLEMQLDIWSSDMKRNILAEFAQSLLRLREQLRRELDEERTKNQYSVHQLQCEIERLKDLVATYEQNIEKKDQVVSKLSGALQKQKSKVELSKSFTQWKVLHSEEKREGVVSQIAYKHYKRRLMLKVWAAWHSTIVSKWKQRVEKACQARAEEVCIQLTNDYEEKIAAMQRSLDDARSDVQRMRQERDMFAENMKQAFMRGVCALNMEAMTMFHPSSGQSSAQPTAVDSSGSEDSVEPQHRGGARGGAGDQLSEQWEDHGGGRGPTTAHPVNLLFSSNPGAHTGRSFDSGQGLAATGVSCLQRGSIKAAEPPKQHQRVPKPRKIAPRPSPAVVVEKHLQL